ncbi:MAG: MCE family protein [Desulfamplus sp.]|nr:MCE family protein [Desulfamplus sp.]
MNKQPNNILIGAFVAGAVALVVIAVLVFGSGSFFQDNNLFVLHFKGSVKGLSVGSPVVLRGVKVGSVRDIRINAMSNSRSFSIPVIVEIGNDLVVMPEDSGPGYDSNKDSAKNFSLDETLKDLIDKGLRAQLEMQSMVTGQLLVGLDFHPDKPARLSGHKSEYPEIPTIQTDIEEFTQKIKQVPIEEIFNKIFSIISTVEKALNEESIGDLLTSLSLVSKSINKISDSLYDHLPGMASEMEETIKSAKVLMQNSNHQVIAMSGSINQTVSDLQSLVNTAKDQVETNGTAIGDTLKDTNRLIASIKNEVPPVSKSIKDTLATTKETLYAAKEASDQATVMLKGVDRITGKDSALINNLNATLNDLSDAARSLRLLAEYLERHPEALIQGKR